MQAPDLQTLLDFEAQFDAIWPLVLTEFSDAGVLVVPLQAEGDLPLPRVEVHFRVTGVAGPQGMAQVRQASAPSIASAYGFEIVAALYTRRRANASVGEPKNLRGLVRVAFSGLAARINAKLDYVQILTMEETDSNRGIGSENREDIQTFTFSGLMGIKTDAWPG